MQCGQGFLNIKSLIFKVAKSKADAALR